MIEINPNKKFIPGELIAIQDPNLRMPAFFLKDKKRMAMPKEPLTLSQYEERVLHPNVVDSMGHPLTRIYFGLSECCEECRTGKPHFVSDIRTFYSVFASVEDLTDPKEVTKETPKEEQPALPFAEKDANLVDVADAIAAHQEICHILGTKSSSFVQDLFFGRWRFSVYKRSPDQLSVEEISQDKNAIASYTSYTTPNSVPYENVRPLMDYYMSIIEDLDKVSKYEEEIKRLYDAIQMERASHV